MKMEAKNRDGYRKILDRLGTFALIGLMVLALVALPHSLKVNTKSGWIDASLEHKGHKGTFVQNMLDGDSHL